MREKTLRSVLMVKAIEDVDRAGTIIPPGDRAQATRDTLRALLANRLKTLSPQRRSEIIGVLKERIGSSANTKVRAFVDALNEE